MKRRRFFQGLIASPAVPALLAQQPGARPAPTADEGPKIEATVADAAAEMEPKFFTAPQFAALRRLCDALVPAVNGTPGALDAHAPEFLDFLIGESPGERQQVYRAGLDALNAQARKVQGKAFADLDSAQVGEILAPLKAPWTYETPADPLARLLRVAKQDVRTATVNSREYSTTSAGGGGRRFGGTGLYWYPLD